ncbi:MAG: hypothetical protein AAB722_01420 [Patescibacteria group bacterium]
MKFKNFQIPNSKIQGSGGYAAMFSFLVMTTILGILISVFTLLVFKSIFLARTSIMGFKNIYAVEGFIEDTLKRVRDPDLADVANDETLEIGDVVAAVSLSSEGPIKHYYFSSQISQKYFGNGVLILDGAGSSAKIKKWQDTQ